MITLLVLVAGSLACAGLSFFGKGLRVRRYPVTFGLITILYMVVFATLALLLMVI